MQLQGARRPPCTLGWKAPRIWLRHCALVRQKTQSVMKVTVTWKNFHFQYLLKRLPILDVVVKEVKSVVDSQSSRVPVLPEKVDPFCMCLSPEDTRELSPDSCAQQVPSLSHIIVEGRDMMYKLVYDTEEEMALADALSHLLCTQCGWESHSITPTLVTVTEILPSKCRSWNELWQLHLVNTMGLVLRSKEADKKPAPWALLSAAYSNSRTSCW